MAPTVTVQSKAERDLRNLKDIEHRNDSGWYLDIALRPVSNSGPNKQSAVLFFCVSTQRVLYLLIPLKEAPIAYSRPFPFHHTHIGSFNHFLEAFTHYKLSLNIISRDGWCVLHYFLSLCLEIAGKHFFSERSTVTVPGFLTAVSKLPFLTDFRSSSRKYFIHKYMHMYIFHKFELFTLDIAKICSYFYFLILFAQVSPFPLFKEML